MANISREEDVTWLEKLPDGSYLKKNPTTKAGLVKFEDGSTVEEHKAESMPHEFVDGGRTFKWGFRTKNGKAQFIYEEVL